MFAAVTDVESTWRPLSDRQTTTAMVLLDRISAVMRRDVPSLSERVASDPDTAIIARGVAVDAVLRVLRNPEGKVQESLDDYAYRRSDAVADGLLYLTDAELALLSPAGAAVSLPKMGTARLGSPRLGSRVPW